MIRPILKMGTPSLYEPSAEVEKFDTPELHALIADLEDTMRAAKGAGIAAPQIGVNLQVVIFGSDEINPRYPEAPVVPRTVLINPQITPLSEERDSAWEGCLSVPGMRGVVPRYTRIRYTGFDEHGSPLDREALDFHARVVQHECDHLWGILYPMRIEDMKNFGYTSVFFPDLEDDADD
jgi:peptide deformylase